MNFCYLYIFYAFSQEKIKKDEKTQKIDIYYKKNIIKVYLSFFEPMNINTTSPSSEKNMQSSLETEISTIKEQEKNDIVKNFSVTNEKAWNILFSKDLQYYIDVNTAKEISDKKDVEEKIGDILLENITLHTIKWEEQVTIYENKDSRDEIIVKFLSDTENNTIYSVQKSNFMKQFTDKGIKKELSDKLDFPIKRSMLGLLRLPIYPFLYSKKKREEQRLSWTPKQREIAEKIEAESWGKVKIVVDPDFISAFGKVMGIDYRWSGVWDFVVVRNQKNLEDETILRHEAIHCMQQRDCWWRIPFLWPKLWLIPWTIVSLSSLLIKKYFGKLRWLRERADYATDNQLTDLETYLYETDPNYLKNRKPFWYKILLNPTHRKQEMKKLREEQVKELVEKRQKSIEESEYILQELEKKIKDNQEIWNSSVIEDLQIRYNEVKEYIETTKEWIKKIQDESEFNVVLIEKDLLHSKNPGVDQRRVQGTGNLKQWVATEKQIQKQGKEKDNYKDWVETYIENKNSSL